MKPVIIIALAFVLLVPLTLQNAYACSTYLDIGSEKIFNPGETIDLIVKLSDGCTSNQEVKYSMSFPSGGSTGGKILLEPNTQENVSLKIPKNAVSGKYNIQSNASGAQWSMIEFWVIQPTEKIEDFVEKRESTSEKSNYGSISNSIDVVVCNEYNSDGSCKVGIAGVHLQDYYDAQNRMYEFQVISGIVIVVVIVGIIIAVIIGVSRSLKNRNKNKKFKEQKKLQDKKRQDDEIRELKKKVEELERDRNKRDES